MAPINSASLHIYPISSGHLDVIEWPSARCHVAVRNLRTVRVVCREYYSVWNYDVCQFSNPTIIHLTTMVQRGDLENFIMSSPHDYTPTALAYLLLPRLLFWRQVSSWCIKTGGLAAFTVDLLVYPLDTLKTRFQSRGFKSPYYDKVKNAVNKAVLFRGFYQGVESVILVTLPSCESPFTN